MSRVSRWRAKQEKKSWTALRSSQTPFSIQSCKLVGYVTVSPTNGSCLGLVIPRPFLVVSHPGPWRWKRGVWSR